MISSLLDVWSLLVTTMQSSDGAIIRTPQVPETVWPVSVGGWVALLLAVASFIGMLWKANNGPVLKELTRIENAFNDKLVRIEKDIEHEFAASERRTSAHINGFGERVNGTEKDISIVSEQYVGLMQRITRNESQAESLSEKVSETRGKVDTAVRLIGETEGRLRDKIDHEMSAVRQRVDNHTSTLLQAISSLRNGNGPRPNA